jgi:hypothetical protein
MTSQSAEAMTTGSAVLAAALTSRRIARAARSWWPSSDAVTEPFDLDQVLLDLTDRASFAGRGGAG